jgi:uncharacterized membrane protein
MPHGSGHAHARAERVVPPAATAMNSSHVSVIRPDDAVEVEADRIADQIGPRATVARSAGQPPPPGTPGSVQSAVGSPGRPLAESERPAALNIDFSQVRVHTDRRATESARDLGAASYTLGNDIVLADGYDPATTYGQRLLAHELAHVAQYQVIGNVTSGQLLRQAAPAQPSSPTAEYDALYDALWKMVRRLHDLPNKGQLGDEVAALLADLGAPGEKSGEQTAKLRDRFERFKAGREAAYRAVTGLYWPQLTADYKQEDSRLAQSAEAADKRARTLLRQSYSNTEKELKKTGNLADAYDVMPFADELYNRRYLKKAWEIEMRESLEAGEHPGAGGEENWPPFKFEVTAKSIEAAAKAGHISAELREELLQKLESAAQYQVRHAITQMIDLGESPAAARVWGDKAMKAAKAASEDLVDKFRLGGTLERWHGRLHIAGKITIAIDVIGSIADIVASPPKEWPKKTIIHGSRILGGLAGARVGASAGASFGEEFGGPTGAVVGGFIGGVAGGLEGSIFVEETAEFIADKFWPPEDTYTEVHAD